MVQTKFTGDTANNLKPSQDKAVLHYAINFDPGYPGRLGLRISTKGTRTWFIQYRLLGRSTALKLSIGRLSEFPFKSAKKRASDLLKGVALGDDPKQGRRQELEAVTVSELFDIYYERHAVPNKAPKSAKEDKTNFQNHIEPIIGSVKAARVKRRDLIDLLDKVGDKYPVMRNRLQSLLSMMFNVGVDRELIEHNPAFRMKKVREQPRDRVLSTDEIKALWSEWEKIRQGKLHMVKLLTGQQDKEIRTMRWADIKDGLWTIPGHISKNKKPHQVPLSDQTTKLLSGIEQRGDYVFFSAGGKEGHVTTTSKAFRLSKVSAGLPEDIRGHDLRRTMATWLGEHGTSDEVIGLILNHSNGSVTSRHYNHSRQNESKRIALQKWADGLDRILGKKNSGKVIKMMKQA